MQKPTKVLLGIATLWPIAYLVLFFVFIFSAFLISPETGGAGVARGFTLIFALHLLTMLVIAALTVFYIVNIFRNNQVAKDQKALWAIVIFMGNAIAMPIYWYLYIWKEPAVANFSAPGQLNSADTSAWTSNVKGSRQEQHEYAPPSEPPNWRE